MCEYVRECHNVCECGENTTSVVYVGRIPQVLRMRDVYMGRCHKFGCSCVDCGYYMLDMNIVLVVWHAM